MFFLQEVLTLGFLQKNDLGIGAEVLPSQDHLLASEHRAAVHILLLHHGKLVSRALGCTHAHAAQSRALLWVTCNCPSAATLSGHNTRISWHKHLTVPSEQRPALNLVFKNTPTSLSKDYSFAEYMDTCSCNPIWMYTDCYLSFIQEQYIEDNNGLVYKMKICMDLENGCRYYYDKHVNVSSLNASPVTTDGLLLSPARVGLNLHKHWSGSWGVDKQPAWPLNSFALPATQLKQRWWNQWEPCLFKHHQPDRCATRPKKKTTSHLSAIVLLQSSYNTD